MKEKIKVSFDFDSTLTKQNIQDYAKTLIQKGISVYITTTRFDEKHGNPERHPDRNKNLYCIAQKLLIQCYIY